MLKGKNAVITGCSRGIGKAVLKKFAQNGADIFAVVRKADEQFLREIEKINNVRGGVCCIACDFSDENSVKEAAVEILSYKKKIDIIVNNAGVLNTNAMFNMTSMDEIKRSFQINFFSPLLFTQMLSKNMIRNKYGKIIFLSSIVAFDGGMNIAYTSSKSAVNGAVKRMALEYGQFHICVNAIAPGFTNTDMAQGQKKELIMTAIERNSIKRMAEPDEIADTALFLASHMSDYITGQVIRIDGGRL